MTLQLVSAFDKDGIETIEIARRPRRGMIGRHPFPIIDMRTRSEEVFEAANRAPSFERQHKYLTDQYSVDLPLKEDPIFRAAPVMLFRGSVWHQGEPILGSVHSKHVSDLELWQQKVQSLTDSKSIPRFAGTSAVIQAPGARNYFHWIIEVSPRLFALREYLKEGLGPLDRILLFYDNPGAFVPQWLEVMFPDLAPLIEYCNRSMCALEACLFFTDQKRYEDHTSRQKTTTALLSEAIDQFHAENPRRANRSILISRKDAPTRQIVNEDMLLETFADRGLERVELGALHVRDQMKVMGDADFVIGAHGAGMTNTVFCRPGTVVVEINSTQYIRRCRSFADIAMYRQHPYGLAIVDQHGDQHVVVQNRGNDLEIAPSAVGPLRDLVDKLSAGAE